MMIRIHLAFALCALALMTQGLSAAAEKLVLRKFPVQPTVFDIIASRAKDENVCELDRVFREPAIDEGALMEFFQLAGLLFPEGSYLRYNPLDSSMIHYNTVANHIQLGKLLSWPYVPKQVRIDLLLVDFPLKDIERIARANVQPLPSPEDILHLWREGGGTLLHALNLVTRSGVNAQVMSVRELKYAAGYGHHSPSADADDSVTARSPVSAAFETREYGAILNVTPTVGPDDRTMDLALVMELCTDPEWVQVPAPSGCGEGEQTMMPQPVFHSRNITTSIVVDDQSTHVFGGMTNPNGDGITYVILTATLIDSLGRAWADARADYAGESVE